MVTTGIGSGEAGVLQDLCGKCFSKALREVRLPVRDPHHTGHLPLFPQLWAYPPLLAAGTEFSTHPFSHWSLSAC